MGNDIKNILRSLLFKDSTYLDYWNHSVVLFMRHYELEPVHKHS